MIFAPQNVMGPAHRGGVIQQLAQGAAQNVMRRQKLKALLQHTAAQGHGQGAGQPFRGSTMGHATGVRGATFRPGAAAPFGSPGAQNLQAGPGAIMPVADYPDAGPADLPSLPSNDPAQSPSSTQPGPQGAPTNGVPYGDPGASTGYVSVTPNGGYQSDDLNPATGGGASTSFIPLGNGQFYDPATDTIHTGPTGGGVRPGLQQ